ncbi:trehalose operon repressor [Enterococcus timonensis]|uniref:trehalose operon repressor n=1 Tax=Enterococcus timonensis TaxID=1852364 RepID=UPI0008DA628B|nr:trehalose operon repressor [Enterococcus timonensis]
MDSKFKEIAQDLEQKILANLYPVGSLLPSELQLGRLYNVSRETIRKALNELRITGLIQKKQGKGSIVIDRKRFAFPVSGLTSYNELQKSLGLDSQVEVLSLKKEIVPEKLAEFAQWPLEAKVWQLERLRKVDGQGVILDTDYFLESLVPNLTEKIAAVSTYDYIEEKLKLEIAYAQKEITIEPAMARDKKFLDLGNSDRVVVIRSLVYLADNRCFEFTESRHVLDKFRFVDFARRRKL